jgi:transcriptional regulator with XRE-family HTH domain
MFTNRTETGRNNIVGVTVREYRKQLRISQRELADRLQIIGLDIDKNAVQRIESGQRFITDIELIYLAQVFNITVEELYDGNQTQI